MTERPFIVVSGLPASGKTTLALKLAGALGLPLFDKDDILEALFESAGEVDLPTRQQLSRASDNVLARLAAMSQGAVLVSLWRHPAMDGVSGTPVAWLNALSARLVEIHCVCAPEIAEARFRSRRRHPGHNDPARSDSLGPQLDHLAKLGPLGLQPAISIRTDEAYDLDRLVREVRRHLDSTA